MFVCCCLLFNIHQPTVTVMKKYVFMFHRTFYKSDPTCMQRSQTSTFITSLELSQGWVSQLCAPDLVHAPQSHGRPTAPIEPRCVSLTHPHILLRTAIICWSGQNLPDVLLRSGATSAPVPARLCSSPDIWAFLLVLISGVMRLEPALANC